MMLKLFLKEEKQIAYCSKELYTTYLAIILKNIKQLVWFKGGCERIVPYN